MRSRTSLSGLVLAAATLACGGLVGPEPTVAPGEPAEHPEPQAAPEPEPTACREEVAHAGEASFYGATGGGACGFAKDRTRPLLVAAINVGDWAGSAVCGACARVVGPAGEVTVRIVDRCRGCGADGLDLSTEAFERIASKAQGRAQVTWRFAPCDEAPEALTWHVIEGSHQWWMALQVRDARHAVASLEIADGEGWKALPRTEWNQFVGRDLGKGPFTVRVTDVHGQTVEDQVPLDGGDRAAAVQFPPCAE